MKSLTLTLLALALLATPALAQDYDALIQQALQQRNQGDLPAAEKILRQARGLAKDKAEADYLLGMVLAFQQKYTEGLQIIEAALQVKPDDIELQLGRARVLSYQGVYQQASQITNKILAKEPANLEALSLAGRLAYYQRQPAVAEQRFQHVLALDANNLDALLGLYDSYLQQGETDQAQPWLERAAKVAPTHIEVLTRQQPEQYNAEPRHQISTGYSRSTIDHTGFSNWQDRFIEYRHLQPNGNQQYVRVEHNNRFNSTDTMIEAGLALQQKSLLPLEVAIGVTPNAQFMPHWFGRLQGSTPLTDGKGSYGTVLLTGLVQYSSYANGDTQRLQLGLDYYLPNVDMWLTPNIGMVRDQNGLDTFAWGLAANWQLSGPTRIGASYSDAPETENLVTTDSKNVSVYWRQGLGKTFVLFLTWSQSERVNSYTRKAIDGTLQYRF